MGEGEVFVSYSRKDTGIAERFVEQLVKHGIHAWYDRFIDAGSKWQETLASKIASAEIFIVLFSDSSNKSERCKRS